MSHQHFHNSSLHQSNKSHSGGKHDSKGSIRKRQKGKIEGVKRVGVKAQHTVGGSKQDRRAVQAQLSKEKKMAVLDRKRFGTIEGAPKTVALVSLGDIPEIGKLQNLLLAHCGQEEREENDTTATTFSLDAKQRMTLLTVPRDVTALLDIAKVADIILLCVPADTGIDTLGETFVSLLKAQGLPNIFGILVGLEAIPEKKRHETKKEHQRILFQLFPEEPRVLPLDNANDAGQVIRFISNCTVRSVHWREHRPYLFVHDIETDEPISAETGTVCVTGYLRGGNMSANQLVHIPGVGDFQLKKIEMLNDPHPVGRRDVAEPGKVVCSDEPNEKQHSMVTENVPDLLLNEQTWPTPEELAAGKKKVVPKGTSSYQASWIVDKEEGEEGENDNNNNEDDDDDNDDDEDMGNVGDDKEHASSHAEEDEDEEEEEEEINMDDSTNGAKETEEDDIDDLNESARAERQERQESDLSFPDEVDCPLDTPARLRFQKYRGLKSFRTTAWDPKENLPLDYGRIFQFANITRSMKNATNVSNNPIPAGNFVKLHIANVPLSLAREEREKPTVVGGLFNHENKMSVLQFNVLKHATFEDPVLSKDTLIFHVGIRRYAVSPIFSTINPGCAKQKFERFLQPGRPSCATVYGPVTFAQNPLIVFTPQGQLVATGTLHAVDPDRIIVKKIVLTGSPAKVHKKGAVIRDMFYFPEDAYWFRPVELWTKNGKVGHIKESVGTHGLMKCTFDVPINQNDTVCLSLFKRIFPKWPKVSPSAQYKGAKVITSADEEMKE